VNGMCRSHCFTAADCASCSGQPICNVGYCASQAEVTPQCKTAADCDGRSCVNGACQ
jgi:hypothetical protein